MVLFTSFNSFRVLQKMGAKLDQNLFQWYKVWLWAKTSILVREVLCACRGQQKAVETLG